MANFVYDKKQLPQVIALGTLSVGLFGFFGFKMITPPSTSAAAPPPPPAASSPTASATDAASPSANGAIGASAVNGSLATDPTAFIGAAPPSSAMRNPFIAGMTAAPPPPKPVQVASATLPSAPPVPGLPSMGQVRPLSLPGAPAATPQWTVTGIICSDLEPAHSIAIFRQGDERRYVRLGSMIDDSTKLIGVDRNGVTILRGGSRIRLGLGAPVAHPTSAEPGATITNGIGGASGASSPAPLTDSMPTIPVPALPSAS